MDQLGTKKNNGWIWLDGWKINDYNGWFNEFNGKYNILMDDFGYHFRKAPCAERHAPLCQSLRQGTVLGVESWNGQ